MRPTLTPRDHLFSPETPFPTAIWMPVWDFSQLPSCYQGTPVEMVKAMRDDLDPKLAPSEAIDYLLRFLEDHRGLHIRIDPEADDTSRAHGFILALLATRVAEPMAAA